MVTVMKIVERWTTFDMTYRGGAQVKFKLAVLLVMKVKREEFAWTRGRVGLHQPLKDGEIRS